MELSEQERIAAEVDHRLDDFFGETSSKNTEEARTRHSGFSPVGDLKALVLSLEWEINDDTSEALVKEAERLRKSYAGDIVAETFCTLLRALAKYIGKRKSAALPESVTLLGFVFDGLETVLSEPGITLQKKRALLGERVIRYNALKERIKAGHGEGMSGMAAKAPIYSGDISDTHDMMPHEPTQQTMPREGNFLAVVEDLKTLLHKADQDEGLMGAVLQVARVLEEIRDQLAVMINQHGGN